jgi:NHLM bacteriocin system ABC transporter ATP-binding protein
MTATTQVTRAFALQGAGSVWIVETGKLDVFLAPMEAGSPTGALTHVARIEAGGALFPLPFDTESGLGFLAVPAAETTVQVASFEERNELSALWMKSISQALSPVPEGLSLEQFHEWAAAEWIERRGRTEQEQAERLKARARADQGVVGANASPLAGACFAVGKAAGIEFKIPPSVMQGTARDPVRAIARFSAVRMRRLVLQGNWWKQDSGPMVAFLDEGNKPVALLPRKGRGYELFDPAADTTVRVHRGIAGKLSGVAYVFYRPFPHRALSGWEVLRAGLQGCGRDLWGIVIAGFLASLLALVTPFATGIVFDSIIPGSDRGQLLQAVIFIVASAVAMTFISLTRGYALLRVEGKLDFAAQAAVWDRLLNLPTTFFRNYSAGDLSNRSMAISQIRNILSESVLTAIIAGLFSVTSIFLLFYYSPALTLVAVALAGAALAVTVIAGFMQLGLLREAADNNGKLTGMVFEFVDGIAKFKVSGTEGRAFARWASAFGAQKRMGASIRRIGNVLSTFNATFPVIALLIIFARVAGRIGRQGAALSTGEFLAFNVAFGQLLGSVLALGGGFLAILRIVPLYARIRPIFETLPEIDAAKAEPGELTGSIEVNHLSFRYDSDTPLVVRDVSFSIRPGEFVALVGASGAGKSTLLRLLLGFEKPLSGAIYYDGQDLAGLDLQEVRLQMGIVLQNGKLLPGDILTNIIGSTPLTVDDAWQAVRMAGLEDDIRSLPMGMYTMVSEGGKGLSGGQRQRLMIARAIVRKPRVLIFDEATSALDNRTQEMVSRAMEGMRATRIVIAHRLSTIMKADRILVLDGGAVVQSGSYTELIGQEGLFAELARRQLA